MSSSLKHYKSTGKPNKESGSKAGTRQIITAIIPIIILGIAIWCGNWNTKTELISCI
jgi:hypothetical protein